ncbi:USP6 N-terminal-like protein [Onychostoma macrolepis]|nr:USP6 N-terminal-like protein [Onychostoma macrolepis]
MGDRPEAIEGQAKLFRVLTAFARYNPQIGYVQGMSYIAAVLLMILSEEEAFWALVALLEKPKYLSELFDSSLKKIQHHALVFHQLLKHRKPLLFQHLETLGVSSLHFIMQWFLTLFTSLPCWDSVLAIWDLIMLHGLQAVFRTGLTIILLLESRIMNMTEETTVLPILLRVPVDVSQHRVLIPALWNTDVQEWEINCMNHLVLEEVGGGQDEEKVKKESAKGCTSSLSDGQQDEKPSQEVARNTSKKAAPGSSAKNVFTRLLKVAQHYLLESGKYNAAARSSPSKRTPALGLLPKTKTRTSISFTQAQGRTRRSSSRRSQNSTLGGVKKEQLTSQDSDGGATEDSSSSSAWCVRSGPVGKVARRRSRGQSGRGSSLLLKNRCSRSQQTAAQTFERPESSKTGECQETQSRHVALNERNFITCPMTASQVRESQLI